MVKHKCGECNKKKGKGVSSNEDQFISRRSVKPRSPKTPTYEPIVRFNNQRQEASVGRQEESQGVKLQGKDQTSRDSQDKTSHSQHE